MPLFRVRQAARSKFQASMQPPVSLASSSHSVPSYPIWFGLCRCRKIIDDPVVSRSCWSHWHRLQDMSLAKLLDCLTTTMLMQSIRDLSGKSPRTQADRQEHNNTVYIVLSGTPFLAFRITPEALPAKKTRTYRETGWDRSQMPLEFFRVEWSETLSCGHLELPFQVLLNSPYHLSEMSWNLMGFQLTMPFSIRKTTSTLLFPVYFCTWWGDGIYWCRWTWL